MNKCSCKKIHTLAEEERTKTIYFAGSIRAGREDVSIYHKIILELKKYGRVVTEHVGDYSLSIKGQNFLSDKDIHNRDLNWLRHSDIVVAEITNPSLGVGYEIAMAVNWKIPVVALYRTNDKNLSAMISGCSNIDVYYYESLNEANNIITSSFKKFSLGKEKYE